MILRAIRSGEFLEYLPFILVSIPCILFSLSLHETAHAYVANKLGDPTARSLGRITLNPKKHIDPLGLLFLFVFGFGWAKPVPISSRYFKKPKRDTNLVSIAGPLSNFALSFIILLIASIFALFDINIIAYSTFSNNFGSVMLNLFRFMVWYMADINITLGVFNLLPIPPLDGSHLLISALPSKAAYQMVKYERYIQLGLMALLFMGGLSSIIITVTDRVYSLLLFLIDLILFPFM